MSLFFLSQDFSPNIFLPFDEKNHHYSTNVLRCVVGQEIFVFNGRQGKWIGVYQQGPNRKSSGIFLKGQHLPQPKQEKPLGLFFCPIKRSELLIEKAVELGVTHFFPLSSHYTQGNLCQPQRWKTWAIEACRQSQRLDIPEFFPMKTLEDYGQIFSQYHHHEDPEDILCFSPASRGGELSESPYDSLKLFQNPGFSNDLFLQLFSHLFVLHHESPLSLSDVLRENYPFCTLWPCALFVGPEGGWSPKELDLFHYLSSVFLLGGQQGEEGSKKSRVFPYGSGSLKKTLCIVSLGQRLSGGILRAETAALSGLSFFL